MIRNGKFYFAFFLLAAICVSMKLPLMNVGMAKIASHLSVWNMLRNNQKDKNKPKIARKKS